MSVNGERTSVPPSSRQLLREAFVVLHTFLLAPLILFQINPGILMAFFESSFHVTLTAKLILLGLVPVNIFGWAAILGTFVELAGEETYLVTLRRLRDNGRRYWKDVLRLSIGLLMLHFLLFAVFPNANVQLDILIMFMSVVAFIWLARRIVHDKYVKPMGLEPVSVRVGLADFFIVLGFLAAQALAAAAGAFTDLSLIWLDESRFFVLLSRYVMCANFLYMTGVMLRGYPKIRQNNHPQRALFLINPPGPGLFEGIASLFLRQHPGVFVVLRAFTPPHYHIREFSRILWKDRYFRGGILVCISCFTSNCSEAYRIAKEYRRRGAKVIMGGPHVTYLPEEALDFCDSVVVGEAEGIWEEVIRDYEKGTLKSRYVGQARDDYHEKVHNQLIASEPAVIKDFLETTRGCKFRCHFCTIPGLSSGRTRQKPVFELVGLLEKVKTRYPNVTFIDNNIYSDPGYARELFKALKPLNMKWGTQCTIDIAKNEETLRLARESGCTDFLIGYEISGNSVEQQQRGKFALADNYLNFSRKIQKLGIGIKAHFIFGYDTDNFRSLFELWKFCYKLRPNITIVSILTPLPGAELFEQLSKENRLTNLSWSKYACHALVYRQKGMNNFVLAHLYPVIYLFFLFTTSRFGNFIFWFIIGTIFFLNRQPG